MDVVVDQEVISDSSRIISSVLHQVDVNAKSLQLIPISGTNSDLEGYLTDLLNEIQTKEQKRSYNFLRESTEFYTALKSYAANQDLQVNVLASNLAQRLLDKEIIVDDKYGHLGASGNGHVKKGSFLQFLYQDGGSFSYLGVKIEHQIFLDEEDFKRKIGISIANKIYKACIVKFDIKYIPSEVFVYDTNTKPSTYWWNDFLELKELKDDAHNTRVASKSVLQVISKIKNDHPSDHTLLRNLIIASFKQKGELKYDEFLDKTVKNYTPIDESLNNKLPEIVKTLKDLPEKKGFDTHFTLIPSEVPYRKTNYKLSQEISLIIDDGIAKLNNKIWSEKTASGKKLVVIESPEGFQYFEQKTREL